MNDTSPEIAQKMQEMFERKSFLERIEMGCSMIATSKYLITCAILQENPNISKANLRCELFLRFYSKDFAHEEREKIIKYLKEHTTT